MRKRLFQWVLACKFSRVKPRTHCYLRVASPSRGIQFYNLTSLIAICGSFGSRLGGYGTCISPRRRDATDCWFRLFNSQEPYKGCSYLERGIYVDLSRLWSCPELTEYSEYHEPHPYFLLHQFLSLISIEICFSFECLGTFDQMLALVLLPFWCLCLS